jgi:hypothetical protein
MIAPKGILQSLCSGGEGGKYVEELVAAALQIEG